MSEPSQELKKVFAFRGAQFLRHGVQRLDRLLDTAGCTYASDENGAIECDVAAVRLGVRDDYRAG
jgi:hypothetical protein